MTPPFFKRAKTVSYDNTALVIRQFLRKFAQRVKKRKYLRKTPEMKRTRASLREGNALALVGNEPR